MKAQMNVLLLCLRELLQPGDAAVAPWATCGGSNRLRRIRVGLAAVVGLIGLWPLADVRAGDSGTVSAGMLHTCRVRVDGTLGCWGRNSHGQASPPAGTFVAVLAAMEHSCGVRPDRTLACWGTPYRYGVATPPVGTFAAVSGTYEHNCGVRTDGTLACWGGPNGYGEATPPVGTFAAISVGNEFSCGLRSDGTLTCWGRNDFGQASPPTGTFVAISVGQYHGCGLRADGTLACWGDDRWGQTSPPAGTFAVISAGSMSDCALRGDGTLACWGDNNDGQLSPPPETFAAISVGGRHICGLRSNGTLACWGWNHLGQAPQLAITPTALADGSAGEAYSQALSLADIKFDPMEDDPYLLVTPGFALTAGTLPSGLSLSASGILAGMPTSAGEFSFIVEGEDANGFTAERSYTLAIEGPTDNTPPMILPTVSGTLGNNSWYTGDVTTSWSVTDAESAVTSTVGCNTAILSSDALGAGYTCTATSAGGTSTGSVTVNRDATAPVLAPEVTPSVILLNGSGSVAAHASDALSGVVTQSCAALDTTTVGNHTSICTATDAAGNTATTTVSYSVIYGFVGFAPPVENAPVVNLANAGRTIPFKWRLVDANGTPITNLSGVIVRAVSMSCDSTAVADAVEEYVSASTGFLNHGDGDYQYNWQSPKSYENTCKKVVIDLGDGSTRVALFRFH